MERTRRPTLTRALWRALSFLCLALTSVALASLALAIGVGKGGAQEQPKKMPLKTESFDKDPGWEGHNNRVVPLKAPTVAQDFGYSKTNFAGNAAGELGGQIMRASEPAYYADKIGPVTLDDKLSASGTFALTQTTPGGGIFFGFFRAEQAGGGGRPTGSLGMNLDSERSGARLAVRLITGQNQSCGTFVTPFIPGKFRPTPIRNDGTRYRWTLDYDPQGAGGRGQFKFTLQGDAPKAGEFTNAAIPETHKAEARRRFPDVTAFTVDLPEGYRKQGTTFDHFGVMNMLKPGGRIRIYLDDLHYLGARQDFSQDPNWDASGNRATYQSKDAAGAHDFGFSPTSHAGGKAGEVGGTFWRAASTPPTPTRSARSRSTIAWKRAGRSCSSRRTGFGYVPRLVQQREPGAVAYSSRALPWRPCRRTDPGRPLLPSIPCDRQGSPFPGSWGAGPHSR